MTVRATVSPDFETVAAAFERGETAVLQARRVDDLLTPVAAYLKLARNRADTFLLESVEGGAWRGRYSAIGLDPDLIWQCRNGQVSEARGLAVARREFTPVDEPPMQALRRVIEDARCPLPDGAPPLASGLFGYVGYDMVRYLERLPENAAPDPLDLPESCLLRPRVMVVFDALKQEIQVYSPVRPGEYSAREAYDAAVERMQMALDALAGATPDMARPDAELGPRDVVARAVHREVVGGRGAFLDCRPIGPGIAEEFPTVVSTCRSAGIDPAQEPIPVAPAAHYHMGGVLVDVQGRSTVDGLWACGEVTSTGAHGANRLASNSLLEAVVFGARVAKDIATALPPLPPQNLQAVARGGVPAQPNVEAERTLRETMSAKVGVVRDAEGLSEALGTITALGRESEGDPQLANMLVTAKLVTAAAYARTESRGANFRSDYPAPDEAQAHRSMWTLKGADAIAREAAGITSPPRLRIVSQG